ncbi:Aminopeptidase YpdF (MP-, MA-, MS-, AP-, NP-specific) [hydrothermal vent metagenome]|uniref:Aminopeptidase YpdF (MP-, MA-, MS-, AP-, NP-specific) n=1 Tax=hydrothermal vent metagenome TaxID=652676 RepID=A0A3B1E5N2_9ZZZZ
MDIGKDGFKKFKKFLDLKGYNQNELYLNFMAKSIMSDYGKYQLSFDPITACNENSAKPHAYPLETRFKHNSLFLMDAGVKYERYCSDRTVTYINKKNKLQQKIYDIVLKAQENAINKTSIGMKASEVDKLARDVIEKAGYGKYFVHSTGHGIGLDIHEYPHISKTSDIIIEENMVFTIEPGIYLPNKFGIRIEDTVAIQNNKAVVL